MKNILQIIEQYVEWLALGLALLWAGWMGWSYWGQPVAAVKVGGKMMSAADVDRYYHGFVVVPLQTAMDDAPQSPPAAPDYASIFKKSMGDEFIALAEVTSPFNKPLVGAQPDIDPGHHPQLVVSAEIPTFPSPTIMGTSHGASVAMVGAGAAARPTDLSWVTVSVTCDTADMAAAFANAGVPPQDDFATLVLQVTLRRQEVDANGQAIGPVQTITPLRPMPLAYPDEVLRNRWNYVHWVSQNVIDIVEPAFWPVTGGSPWRSGSTPEPEPEVTPVIKPPVVLPPPKPKVVPKAPVHQRPAGPPAAPPGQGGGGGGGPRRGNYLAGDNSNSDQQPLAPSAPPSSPPGPGPHRGPNGGEFWHVRNIDAPPPPPADNAPPVGRPMAAPPAPAMGGPFRTLFVPAKTNSFEIWAHDADPTTGPQPGHIYIYQVEIKYLNPLWTKSKACKNPADAGKLDITCISDWSKPVYLSMLHFFYVASNGFNGKVAIETHDWKSGNWVRETKQLIPGDAIGNSGWTLVDLRHEADQVAVVVSNNTDGHLVTRWLRVDDGDPQRSHLLQIEGQGPGPGGGGVGPPHAPALVSPDNLHGPAGQ